MRKTAAYFVLLLFSLSTVAQAGNWAHWRGPTGNGSAPDATPPISWSQTKNVKWKVELAGKENSSPIVWENQVFVTTAEPVSGENAESLPTIACKLFCLNRKDGSLIWEKTATVAKPHQKTHKTNGFAGASPCTDGEHVYAHFGSRGLYCYTMDGELVWKRDDFGEMDTLNGFGEGSSPTIEGDKIIVPWDHQGPSALYLLDKRTGDTIWKKDREELTGWATPLVIEHDGRKQIIMNGWEVARSYDLETGEELWHCGGQMIRPITSPVAGNGLVFVGSGFRGAFLGAFHPDGKGDIEGTKHVEWKLADTKKVVSDMASLLLTSTGRIYLHNGKQAPISCLDAATGKPHYMSRRLNALGNNEVYASPLEAGGHIYFTDVNGTTVVIEDADKLKIVSVNKLNEFVGGTMAAADSELFIRSQKALYCIANSK